MKIKAQSYTFIDYDVVMCQTERQGNEKLYRKKELKEHFPSVCAISWINVRLQEADVLPFELTLRL